MCSVLARDHCFIFFFFFLPSSLALSQGASQSLELEEEDEEEEEEEDSLFLIFASWPSTSFFLSSHLWLASFLFSLFIPASTDKGAWVVSTSSGLFFLPVTYVTLVGWCVLHWFLHDRAFSSFFLFSSLSLCWLVLSFSNDLFLSSLEILSSLGLLPPFLTFSSLDTSRLLVLFLLLYSFSSLDTSLLLFLYFLLYSFSSLEASLLLVLSRLLYSLLSRRPFVHCCTPSLLSGWWDWWSSQKSRGKNRKLINYLFHSPFLSPSNAHFPSHGSLPLEPAQFKVVSQNWFLCQY